MQIWKLMTLTSLAPLLITGCSTLMSNPSVAVNLHANWVLLPTINNTEQPQAGGRMDSITASLLRIRGVDHLTTIPTTKDTGGDLFEVASRHNQEVALEQARQQGAQYAVAASVNEWRYKVGLDGEPAVGVSISIIDLSSDQVIWSGSTARSGWSREAVSAVAQKAVNSLLSDALAHANK
jgi:hypothetical protein